MAKVFSNPSGSSRVKPGVRVTAADGGEHTIAVGVERGS